MRGWWRGLHQTHPQLARMLPLLVGVVASLVFVLPVVQPIEHVAHPMRHGRQPFMWGGAALAALSLIVYGVRAGRGTLARHGVTGALLVASSAFMAAAPAIPWAMHAAWASATIDVEEATRVVCELSLDTRWPTYGIEPTSCPDGLLDGTTPRHYDDLGSRLCCLDHGFRERRLVLRAGEALALRGIAERRILADPWSTLAMTAALGALLGLLAAAVFGVMSSARSWDVDDERRLTRGALSSGFGALFVALASVIALETVDGPAPGLILAASATLLVAVGAAWLARVYRSERIRVAVVIVWPAWIAGTVAWPMVVSYCLNDARGGVGAAALGDGAGVALGLIMLLLPIVAVANRRWAVMPR